MVIKSIDMYNKAHILVKDINDSDYLLELTYEDTRREYIDSHFELVSKDDLDTFTLKHLDNWLEKGYDIEIDDIVWQNLHETRNFLTKRMLRQ